MIIAKKEQDLKKGSTFFMKPKMIAGSEVLPNSKLQYVSFSQLEGVEEPVAAVLETQEEAKEPNKKPEAIEDSQSVDKQLVGSVDDDGYSDE